MTRRLNYTSLLCAALACLTPYARSQDSLPALRVPAFTAYSEPDADALHIDDKGVSDWSDAKEKLVWYGKINTPGKLEISVSLRLPPRAISRFTLRVNGQTSQQTLKQTPSQTLSQTLKAVAKGKESGGPVTISFGTVQIAAVGYQRFELEGTQRDQTTFGDIDALVLSGPASLDAHFNLIAPQRGAPSVHLRYPVPPSDGKDPNVTWFYNEVRAKTDPLWSYYMACGWHRGYFGMQVNSPTERRIIFSVWDSGGEAKDRDKVGADNRVRLLAKGQDVYAGDFGNEGTGGHSHLVYNWKTGQTYRFLVSAQPDGAATIYSGYFFFPEQPDLKNAVSRKGLGSSGSERGKWGLIARFRAPKDGGYLKSLYSFDEDWNSPNGQRRRLAEFGPTWIKTLDGKWTELTTAVFTHTGKDSRTDYDAGAVGSRFYLTGGGYEDGQVKYRDQIQRPASPLPHPDIVLPTE